MQSQTPYKKIGKYLVESSLGQGAMGTVYKGFDPDIKRQVAIKMLHSYLISDQLKVSMLARFRQEAQAAARCMHPNIVTVFDFGVIDDAPYMVMEYVDGIDLKSFLQQQGSGLTIRQVADVIIQVLEALSSAHAKGVVHRDVKPANILLLASGQVKVTDFGVAKLDTSDLTNMGDVIGTPNYMSPEALRSDQIDGRSDLYSVGILLLELLGGQRPKKAAVTWDREALRGILCRSVLLQPHLVQGFTELLMTVLADRPEHRIASAQEFINQLKELLSPDQIYVPDLDQLAATVIQSRSTLSGRAMDKPLPESAPPQHTESHMALNPDVLRMLSQTLAPFVGPVAGHLIRNAASRSTSLQGMIDHLSSHIPQDSERRTFLKSLQQTGIWSLPQQQSLSGSSRLTTIGKTEIAKNGVVAAFHISPETQQDLTRLLAHHIGPLASRIFKNALQKATSFDELCESMAKSIPDPVERKLFITKARKLKQG
jgi:serine/threonine protein kinase